VIPDPVSKKKKKQTGSDGAVSRGREGTGSALASEIISDNDVSSAVASACIAKAAT